MDMDQSHPVNEEKNLLHPNQLCVATADFDGQEGSDLPFTTGETIIIVEPCDLMFWYIGKNSKGETGMVPRTLLEPAEQVGESPSNEEEEPRLPSPPPSPPYSDNYIGWKTEEGGGKARSESYLPMFPVKPPTPPPREKDPLTMEVVKAQEKEKKRRLPPGTLVMGTCQFPGDQEGDLPFNVYEEMTILSPLPDLCWYHAQKTDSPDKKGGIPITHVRLVYMSDDEEEDIEYRAPPKPGHDRLYDDINEFISQSGWFSYPGLAHGKPALFHVLAKKARMSYELFMGIKTAIYMIQYRQGEKLYIGKAKILHEEICRHFECFDKKRGEMREIDDELCHHTDSSGWEISVWPLQPDQVVEVEWAKKIIEHDSLMATVAEKGLNEGISFSSMKNFDSFWEWFSPN